MQTIGEIIIFVSRQLSDQRKNREFTRWNRRDLLNYLNLGLKEIAAYRAEAFASETKIQLVAGAKQKVPEGATITGLIDSNSNLPVNKTDDSLLKAFSVYNKCPPIIQWYKGSPVYKIKSFAQDSADSNSFYVSPPVPEYTNVEVIATIQGKAPTYTFQDWNVTIKMQDKYFNSLIDWMMASAYKMDTESQVSQVQARQLLQGFYSIMGVKYKMDSARSSGYYEGNTGTGDPRSAVT